LTSRLNYGSRALETQAWKSFILQSSTLEAVAWLSPRVWNGAISTKAFWSFKYASARPQRFMRRDNVLEHRLLDSPFIFATVLASRSQMCIYFLLLAYHIDILLARTGVLGSRAAPEARGFTSSFSFCASSTSGISPKYQPLTAIFH
jgi:hypothetical protein